MNRCLMLLAIAASALTMNACTTLKALTTDTIVGAPAPSPTAAGVRLDPGLEQLPTSPTLIVGPILARDLIAAAFNLDEAVRVGALPANDPAPTCIHNVLRQAGIGPEATATDRPSFSPKKDGIVSAGTVLYILNRQAQQQASQRVTVSTECLQLLGQVQIDVLRMTGRVGAASLPSMVTGGTR